MTKRVSRPTYRVTFGRVGRHAPGTTPDLTVITRGATELDQLSEVADATWRHVKRRLMSHTIEVDVAGDGTGTIVVGQGRPAGSFTWTKVEEVPSAPRAA